jgi:hypothetical protein
VKKEMEQSTIIDENINRGLRSTWYYKENKEIRIYGHFETKKNRPKVEQKNNPREKDQKMKITHKEEKEYKTKKKGKKYKRKKKENERTKCQTPVYHGNT